MRKLFFAPVLHAGSDMVVNTSKLPTPNDDFSWAVEKSKPLQNRIWASIERGASRLPKDLRGNKIFSEGMREENVALVEFLRDQILNTPLETQEHFERVLQNPTDEELKILKADFLDGNQSRLILRLALRGARIEVTEGENYKKVIEVMTELGQYFIDNPNSNYAPDELSERFNTYLPKRDRDIANSINTKLKEGETGILIIGYVHEAVLRLLDNDITVESIDESVWEVLAEFREIEKSLLEKSGGSQRELKG